MQVKAYQISSCIALTITQMTPGIETTVIWVDRAKHQQTRPYSFTKVCRMVYYVQIYRLSWHWSGLQKRLIWQKCKAVVHGHHTLALVIQRWLAGITRRVNSHSQSSLKQANPRHTLILSLTKTLFFSNVKTFLHTTKYRTSNKIRSITLCTCRVW